MNIDDIYDTGKTDILISEIDESNIDDEAKAFLKIAAYRHTRFNYEKIAEFYANADRKTQELMEKSALVIIDIDDAIANGYMHLSETMSKLIEGDGYEE